MRFLRLLRPITSNLVEYGTGHSTAEATLFIRRSPIRLVNSFSKLVSRSDLVVSWSVHSLAEAAITAQPSKAALRDPGQSRDLKCALLSFHDLELPAIPAQEIARQLSAFVARVGENRANPWEQRTQATEHASSDAPVRDARWFNQRVYILEPLQLPFIYVSCGIRCEPAPAWVQG
jgi:hypothetical protein